MPRRLGRPWGRVKDRIATAGGATRMSLSETPTTRPVKSAVRVAEVIVQTIEQGSGSR